MVRFGGTSGWSCSEKGEATGRKTKRKLIPVDGKRHQRARPLMLRESAPLALRDASAISLVREGRGESDAPTLTWELLRRAILFLPNTENEPLSSSSWCQS